MNHVATSQELAAFVGQTGRIDLNGLSIQVKVQDARLRFGHIDLLLTPEAGDGQRWVEAKGVRLDATAQ